MDSRSRESKWPLGKAERTSSGLWVRQMPGSKVKPWPHEPDQRIDIWAPPWVTPTLYDLMLLAELFADNEDRIFNQPGHKGAQMVWEALADVPLIGAEEAYKRHVLEWRVPA